ASPPTTPGSVSAARITSRWASTAPTRPAPCHGNDPSGLRPRHDCSARGPDRPREPRQPRRDAGRPAPAAGGADAMARRRAAALVAVVMLVALVVLMILVCGGERV